MRVMSGLRKQFNKGLYQQYDALAREATTELLASQGFSVVPNPDDYAQDLVVSHKGKQWLAECEVKTLWKHGDFPFDSVQLPERKKKFFNTLTTFFIWNMNLTKAAMFWSKDVATLTPVEVPNKYIAGGEYFYQIPLNMVRFVSRESGRTV